MAPAWRAEQIHVSAPPVTLGPPRPTHSFITGPLLSNYGHWFPLSSLRAHTVWQLAQPHGLQGHSNCWPWEPPCYLLEVVVNLTPVPPPDVATTAGFSPRLLFDPRFLIGNVVSWPTCQFIFGLGIKLICRVGKWVWLAWRWLLCLATVVCGNMEQLSDFHTRCSRFWKDKAHFQCCVTFHDI